MNGITSELEHIEKEAKTEALEGLASTKEELALKLQSLEKPLTIEGLQQILDTTIKCDGPNKVITFLTMLLTYTDSEQVNVGFLAESSTGKSYIPLELSWYFPKEDVIKLGYVSPTAFFHEWGQIEKTETFEGERHAKIHVNLANKLLIFLDMPHAGLLERLRPLLSHDERQIQSRITDRTQKYGMKTKTVIITGYPTVLFCSANESLNEQEKTRLLLLSPEKSQEKLLAALMLKLLKESDREAFNRYMESEPSRVFLRARVECIKAAGIKNIIIPENLRSQILKQFTEKRRWLQPRHLRDISRLLALIKAHGLLNYAHRPRSNDTLTVNVEDVEAGLKLYEAVSEPNELGVSPEQYEVYKAMQQDGAEGYNIREFQKLYFKYFYKPVGYGKAWKILNNLSSAGLLTEGVDETDKRQKKYFLFRVRVDSPSSLCTPSENNSSNGENDGNYFTGGADTDTSNFTLTPSRKYLGPSDGAVERLSPSEAAEKCEVCGKQAVEWKVYLGGQWVKRCSSCLEQMKASGLRLHYLPLTEETSDET